MIINAFSNNRQVIASEFVLMFGSSDSLILNLKADNGFTFNVILEFYDDETEKRNLEYKVNNNSLV